MGGGGECVAAALHGDTGFGGRRAMTPFAGSGFPGGFFDFHCFFCGGGLIGLPAFTTAVTGLARLGAEGLGCGFRGRVLARGRRPVAGAGFTADLGLVAAAFAGTWRRVLTSPPTLRDRLRLRLATAWLRPVVLATGFRGLAGLRGSAAGFFGAGLAVSSLASPLPSGGHGLRLGTFFDADGFAFRHRPFLAVTACFSPSRVPCCGFGGRVL